MNSKIQDDERAGFSDRLKSALIARGFDPSPSRFVAEFNLRADGVAVTVHGARKWLIGDAIPTQARLQVLADWLGVSAAWLRYGEAGNNDVHSPQQSGFSINSDELVFVHDLRLLSEIDRQLLRDIVDSMLKRENAKFGPGGIPRREQK